MKNLEQNVNDFDPPLWMKLVIIFIFFFGIYELTGLIAELVKGELCKL